MQSRHTRARLYLGLTVVVVVLLLTSALPALPRRGHAPRLADDATAAESGRLHPDEVPAAGAAAGQGESRDTRKPPPRTYARDLKIS